MSVALPREDHDSGDLGPGAKVDHPDGPFDVEVVEHGAAGEPVGRAGPPVDRPRRVTVLPLLSHVPLPLSPVVDPRLLSVCHVLHCAATATESAGKI